MLSYNRLSPPPAGGDYEFAGQPPKVFLDHISNISRPSSFLAYLANSPASERIPHSDTT